MIFWWIKIKHYADETNYLLLKGFLLKLTLNANY